MGLKGLTIDGTRYALDYRYLDNLPTVDADPAQDSANLVTSGGVYAALQAALELISALQTRVSVLEGYHREGSSLAASLSSGGELSLTGEGASLDGTKLSISSPDASLEGNGLILTSA